MNKKDYLKQARKNNWAIGHFNFSTVEILKAIFQASQKLNSPVIIGTSEGESNFFGLEEAVSLRNLFCKKYGVKAFLNLDHGKNLEYIKKAVDLGYDFVHFDGSKLPLEENIKIAKEIVKYGQKKNVLVEGEVGIVQGSSVVHQEKLEMQEEDLTLPDDALRFIEETKADILAVNVGTFHGMDKSGENSCINIQRLKEIKNRIGDESFLVLHGGSGTPEEDVKEAIKSGINIVHISTELRLAFANAIKEAFENNKDEVVPYKFLLPAIVSVQKVVEEKIRLFNSENKADE